VVPTASTAVVSGENARRCSSAREEDIAGAARGDGTGHFQRRGEDKDVMLIQRVTAWKVPNGCGARRFWKRWKEGELCIV
jgi:hypothetical protein